MRACPFCNALVGDAASCDSCGRRLPPEPREESEGARRRAVSRKTARLDAPPPPDDAMLAQVIIDGAIPDRRAQSDSGSPAERRSPASLRENPDRRQAPPVLMTQAGSRHSVGRASTVPADPPPLIQATVPRARRVSGPPPTPPAQPPSATAPPPSAARAPVSEPSVPPPTRPILTASGAVVPPPRVLAMPEVPEAGVVAAARYALAFGRGRWQRGRAIRFHQEGIRIDTASLDGELYELGAAVHSLGIDNRATAAEVRAIEAAEDRRASLGGETVDLQRRLVEEEARFTELEAEREGKVAEAERVLELAEAELEAIEAQRRALRDKRKQVEKQLKAYLKAAEDREADAAKLAMGDERQAMRRSAEDHRREAAALDPERQDTERKLAALDKPHAQATAKVESLKAELEAARRSLRDAREGHRHRRSELDAEQGRKGKELSQAAAEIHKRLTTLGTIVNLNRVERPELDALYNRIDRLRDNINERSRQIDRLTVERETYDRGALLRGAASLAVVLIALLTIVIVVIAAR